MDSTYYEGNTSTWESHRSVLDQGLSRNDVYDENNFMFGQLPQGHPGWVEDIFSNPGVNVYSCIKRDINGVYYDYSSMSKDEAIGILLGLALLKRYMPPISDRACEIADKIISKVSNGDSWVIPVPDACGGHDGLDANAYAFGFATAGEYFGHSAYEYILPDFPMCWRLFTFREIWMGTSTATWDIPNNAMECTLAAIGNSYGQYLFPWQIVPYPPTITMQCIYNKCIDAFNGPTSFTVPGIETFYCLLFNNLHPEYPVPDDVMDRTEQLLSKAPPEGPYNYGFGNYSGNGWSYSRVWHGDYSEDYLGENFEKGTFSGLDYMLLYNMYLISVQNQGELDGYFPRSSMMLNENWPIEFNDSTVLGDVSKPQEIVACSSIKSVSKIRNSVRFDYRQDQLPLIQQINSPADIIYDAQNIILQPGFIVERGATFSAIARHHITWDNNFRFTNLDYGNYGLVNPYDESVCSGLYIPGSKNITEIHVNKEKLDTSHFKTSMKEVYFTQKQQNNLMYRIYPNPVSSILILEITGEISSNCYGTISNTDGLALKNFQIPNSLTHIDLQDLPIGLYFINIFNFDNQITEKLIKL